MDLTRPVSYRNLQLNDSGFGIDPTDPTKGNPAIAGIQIDSVDYSDVAGIGYSEKRSMDDGFDASDVFLGMRRVQLQGTVYGVSRADLYDRLQKLRYAFSPTAAYADQPGDFGYLPLAFDVPTLDGRWPVDSVDPTLRFIPQALRVRPSRLPQWTVNRDRVGGEDPRGLAMQWMATLDAKDPRVYAQAEQDFTGWVGKTSGSGSFLNRGDYPAPLNILLYAPAGTGASTLDLVIGGSNMHLKMPTNATKAQTLRYDGTKKVVTLQVDSSVSLRMDLLSFTAGYTHPLIYSGANPFTYARTAGVVAIPAQSHMWFWESWA